MTPTEKPLPKSKAKSRFTTITPIPNNTGLIAPDNYHESQASRSRKRKQPAVVTETKEINTRNDNDYNPFDALIASNPDSPDRHSNKSPEALEDPNATYLETAISELENLNEPNEESLKELQELFPPGFMVRSGQNLIKTEPNISIVRRFGRDMFCIQMCCGSMNKITKKKHCSLSQPQVWCLNNDLYYCDSCEAIKVLLTGKLIDPKEEDPENKSLHQHDQRWYGDRLKLIRDGVTQYESPNEFNLSNISETPTPATFKSAKLMSKILKFIGYENVDRDTPFVVYLNDDGFDVSKCLIEIKTQIHRWLNNGSGSIKTKLVLKSLHDKEFMHVPYLKPPLDNQAYGNGWHIPGDPLSSSYFHRIYVQVVDKRTKRDVDNYVALEDMCNFTLRYDVPTLLIRPIHLEYVPIIAMATDYKMGLQEIGIEISHRNHVPFDMSPRHVVLETKMDNMRRSFCKYRGNGNCGCCNLHSQLACMRPGRQTFAHSLDDLVSIQRFCADANDYKDRTVSFEKSRLSVESWEALESIAKNPDGISIDEESVKTKKEVDKGIYNIWYGTAFSFGMCLLNEISMGSAGHWEKLLPTALSKIQSLERSVHVAAGSSQENVTRLTQIYTQDTIFELLKELYGIEKERWGDVFIPDPSPSISRERSDEILVRVHQLEEENTRHRDEITKLQRNVTELQLEVRGRKTIHFLQLEEDNRKQREEITELKRKYVDLQDEVMELKASIRTPRVDNKQKRPTYTRPGCDKFA